MVKLRKLLLADDLERGGFVLVDKPSGLTSFDVVRSVKKSLQCKRVGHSGTLDPLATGLLIIAFGRATKFLEYLLGMDKQYEVLAYFGAVSDTYDADGEITEMSSREFLVEEVERAIAENFVGEIEQVPPKFSALKIDGRRAYDLARAGEEVNLKARKLVVQAFEFVGGEWPLLRFRIDCGSGTYIRSLVHDLGAKLGCGAYVKELRRTKIGGAAVQEAGGLEHLKVLPLEFLTNFYQTVELSEDQMRDAIHGKDLVCVKGLATFSGKVVGMVE